jgi:hypothetical protein
MGETEDYDKSATPTAHKTSHQDGGSDEISVTGLSGLLGDAQTPLAHKTSHQDTGADEISVEGLAGELTAEQKSAWTKVSGKPTTFTPETHADHHQDGGTDEISVAALSGVLADDQHIIDAEAVSAMGTKASSNPLNHDRYADSEALAAAVQAGAITDGVTKAPTHDAVYDVKVMTEDHNARHEDGGLDEISVAGLSGVLADPQTPVVQAKFSANKNGTNQTAITTATWTKVTFGTEEYDVGSKYDAANSKWVPGVVGQAHIDAAILFGGLADQCYVDLAIYKNGASYKLELRTASGTAGQGTGVHADINITAITDYFEIYCYHTRGSDATIDGTANVTFFAGHVLV